MQLECVGRFDILGDAEGECCRNRGGHPPEVVMEGIVGDQQGSEGSAGIQNEARLAEMGGILL